MNSIVRKIPNFLTVARMIGTIFMVFYYLYGSYKFDVLWVLFTVLSISDFFDGYISRKFNATSNFGKCLDPISDKLLLLTTLFIVVDAGILHIVFAFLLMAREITISGLREFLALERIELPVSRLAKWKTAIQLVAVGTCFFVKADCILASYQMYLSDFIILYPLTFLIDNIYAFMYVMLYLAIYTSFHTACVYIYKSRKFLM